VGNLLSRHRNLLLSVLTIAGVAALIWIDSHHGRVPSGTSAPDFKMSVLGETRTVSLGELRGQPAVLDFWATWCGPCRASLPKLDTLSKSYAGRARFFAVNAENEDPALQSEARDQLKLTMTVLTDGRATASQLRVEGYPTTVILDREGKVAETFTGITSEEVIARALDKLL
jgi:cytochrome c biogenesis protein CcmG/thiol:disulfide interchange protein DsbE